jgi:hypothetical protein
LDGVAAESVSAINETTLENYGDGHNTVSLHFETIENSELENRLNCEKAELKCAEEKSPASVDGEVSENDRPLKTRFRLILSSPKSVL